MQMSVSICLMSLAQPQCNALAISSAEKSSQCAQCFGMWSGDALNRFCYLQALAADALRVVPQCDASALKNLMWAVGTAELYDQKLLVAVEAQIKLQSSSLG